MISKEEIEKLAGLARLALTEEEKAKFQSEIEAILGFVAKVKEAAEDAPPPEYSSINVLRNDEVLHNGEYTEDLLNAAPMREDNFVKVKKILE
ncbi:MAG: Asp-tRNA(Asn)/Glu-tRNA(Gln) amidotransferase subunit GatC [Patescibacteria group bacterium]